MYLDNVYKKRKKINKENISGFFLSIMPVLGFILFGLIPMVLALIMSFADVGFFSLDGGITFNNGANYVKVLHDSKFWKAIGNTLYMSLSTFINIVLALIIAFLLTKNIKGKKIFRTIYFIPYVCSVVAITLMWQYIFNAQYGIINQIFLPEGAEKIQWLGRADLFIPCLIIIGVWSGTGFGIILYGAALTNVNTSLYEAARVDGANAFQSFLHITLPAISPTTFYLLITGIIGSLQEFSRPQVLANGGTGPDDAGLTVVFYLWQYGFEYNEMGTASATAWLLAILILGITAVNFGVSKLWVSND